MFWLHPPRAKIFEALGAVADGRVEMVGTTAQILSSSRNKSYTVTHDPTTQSIMANDNASFYHDYLGYPAIAFLLLFGELTYEPQTALLLKNIPWKDLNQKFKNDYEETLEYILSNKTIAERTLIEKEVRHVEEQLQRKHYRLLGKKVQPPKGY